MIGRRASIVLLAMTVSCCSAMGISFQAAAGNAPRPGLAWILFQSPNFERTQDLGIDPRIDFDTGTAARDYSKLWIGMLVSPTDEEITLYAEADNGCRLFIDGRLFIDAWASGSGQAAITIKRNFFAPLRLEYFQDGGTAYMRLFWSWKGHARELIPAAAFFHSPRQQQETLAFAQAKQTLKLPPHREDRAEIYIQSAGEKMPAISSRRSLPADSGPHLFIDDDLIESISNSVRRVVQPARDRTLPNPLVTGPVDRCFQPFFSVLRSPETGRFRLWYGAWRDDRKENRSNLAYMESEDGIRWNRPPVLCSTPEIQFGSEVIDRGSEWPDRSERYVYGYWHEGGLRIAVSPDGLAWRPLVDHVVLPHDHDINNVWWDPIRKHFLATLSTYMPSPRWIGQRRTTMQSASPDLIHWSPAAYVLYADPARGDAGRTEFYAMSAFLVRGPLIVAMVKVLRDDLVAEGVERGAFGRAYTSLAWSRDGRHWVRDQRPFFEPDPDPASWDHAHTWIDEQLLNGDSIYLYYGGYKQGHKANRFSERQIGLVKMPLDRYVARQAEKGRTANLLTVPFAVNFKPSAMIVNADASGGTLRVQVRDAQSGKVVPGLGLADCRVVRSDGIRLPLVWGSEEKTRELLASLSEMSIRLEFQWSGASLFAFELQR